MKYSLLLLLVFSISVAHAAPVPLPFTFESGSIVNTDFLNFNGGTATVVANPAVGGINTTATVGQLIRNGGAIFAGAFLTTPANVDFSANPFICMKVYTTAPIGTRIALKMEGCGGSCSREIDAFTTVSGAWETLCYDFTGEPTSYNRVVFLFDLGNVGDGSANSTFYFDDVEQRPEAVLPLTPGSQYFCPDASLELTFPGSGTYNWYSDPAGTALVQAASSTYNTPILTGNTSYYVQDMTPTTFPTQDVGPTSKGSSNTETPTASTFFTSNLDNGFWYSVDLVQKIVGGSPPSCQYAVTAHNLTQATSVTQTLTFSGVNVCDNCQNTYTFPAPLPMDFGDNMEMRVTVSGHPACYISSHFAGGDVITSFPTTTADGALTFTGHTPVANNWTGFDFRVSGDIIDATLSQVNCIADCALAPLPIELLEFSVESYNTDAALLSWTTVSEINNDYFILERSLDAQRWLEIAKIDGAGTSNEQLDYEYLDETIMTDQPGYYYRLKQLDFDGTSSNSKTIFIELNTSSAIGISIMPNPASHQIDVKGQNLNAGKVEIVNVLGQSVSNQTRIDQLNPSRLTIDISQLANGFYYFISNAGERKIAFVKR